MFDKYRSNGVTLNYMRKNSELERLEQISEYGGVLSDDDLRMQCVLDAYVESTNRCNLNCLFCARENMVRDYDRMGIETFKKAIDKLPEGTYLSLQGDGEPTLNVDLYDLIEYATERGMFVSITTNGSALNENNRRRLINSGVSRVQFSFQSIDKETDESIMRGRVWEKAFLNILHFIKEVRTGQKKIYISISRVKIEESMKYADITKKFWERCPIDNYYEGEYLSLQTDSRMYKRDEVEKLEYKPCANPWTTVKVNANGDVNPCALDFSSKYVIGNINDKDLLSILNSEKAIEFRRASLTGDMEFLDKIGYHCQECNTWRDPVCYDIHGARMIQMPIRLGLLINELSADRPSDISFVDKAIQYLESGGVDVIHDLMSE